MLRLWHITLLSGLTLACSADEDPIVGDTSVSVLHYDFHFDMDTRQAVATLQLRLDQDGDCFELPMRTEGIDALLLDQEAPVSAEYLNATLKLCGAGWPAGSEIAFGVTTIVPEETWGDSQVGYSVRQDAEGTDFSYLVSWVGGCDRFGPCDSSPSAFAKYRLTIDHPSGEQVLCPGIITAGDTQTICDFAYEGGPTYSSFGFAADPSWTKVDLGDWGGISTTLYDLPSADLAGKLNIDEHRDFTAWMVENFGPYPYGNELRFATAPTYWNGFEHPGNIVLNEQLSTVGAGTTSYSNPLAHTTSHEIAHQWAGNQTTLAGTYDFVWKEAMANYLVYVHMDEFVSPDRARRMLYKWKRSVPYSDYHLVPGEKPPLLDFYGDVYGPGPVILFRQLEALFNRQSVLSALSQLLGETRAISVSDVQEALEEATGANLDTYFEAWVYGEGDPTYPRFAVTVTPGQGNSKVLVKVEQEDAEQGLYGCAFDIALDGQSESEELRVPVHLGPDGMALWTEIVTASFEVTGFRFDPDHQCLGSLATAQSTRTYDPELAEPMVAPAYRRVAP
jgi:aminopeptidase N